MCSLAGSIPYLGSVIERIRLNDESDRASFSVGDRLQFAPVQTSKLTHGARADPLEG